ncbi:MAG: ABC transporter permease [Deltaproteobacteria bacterium]|nr:ABC transporter permease [Deltaproteobacteria bacterium]
MAWRNLWRNPRRSILTLAAIAFATLLLVFMLSWQFGSYETMINAAVRGPTGHLQVQARDYHEKREIEMVVDDPGAILALAEALPEVAAVTPRAVAFALAASDRRTYGTAVLGIDPERENRVSELKKRVRRGDYLAAGAAGQALPGDILATNLRAAPGAEVTLLGQGRDGSVAATAVTVAGSFRSGQDVIDRATLYLRLDDFQETFAMAGAVHQVVVVGRSLDEVPRIKAALQRGIAALGRDRELVVLDWSELMPGLLQSIQLDLVSGFIFYLILIVVVAFSILNTFLMVVLERTREFGMLIAIGVTPGRLSRLLLMESAVMTFLGLLAGILLGSLVTWYYQVHGIEFSGAAEMLRQFGLPERMYPRLSLLSIAVGAGLVFVITALTALYPARRVKRLSPLEAMKG